MLELDYHRDRTPYEKLSARTVKILSLLALLLVIRLIGAHQEKVGLLAPLLTVGLLVVQYPLFRFITALEKRRRVTLCGDELIINEYKREQRFPLASLTVECKTIAGYLPHLRIRSGKLDATIPLGMQRIERLPAQLQLDDATRKRVEGFIAYHTVLDREQRLIATMTNRCFAPLLFLSAAASYIVWESALEAMLFYMLLATLFPVIAHSLLFWFLKAFHRPGRGSAAPLMQVLLIAFFALFLFYSLRLKMLISEV